MPSSPSLPVASVLVVDGVAGDEPAIRALLDVPQLQVLRAGSAAQALELAMSHDLVAALVALPSTGIDGFDLAARLRAADRSHRVPIVFVGADAREKQRRFEGEEAAAIDFIDTPIEPRVLRGKVSVFVELEQQRRDAQACQAQLQRLIESSWRMTVAMTHDLRSPLSVIAMNAELVRMRGRDDLLQQAAARIKSSSARMGRMIDQLLAFSGMRSGPLRRRAVDLRELASALVAELASSAPEATIELQGEGDASVVVDPDRMRQGLANLVNNALQHGRSGEPVHVCIDGSQADRVRVQVRNAGVLPPEVQAEPFAPFRSISTSPATGLGLGLYLVQQMVQAHGATVALYTDTDGGGQTIAEISIPRDAAGEPA